MRQVFGLILVCLALSISQLVFAVEVNIVDYPAIVNSGQPINVKVTWKDIPLDKDYVLRVQLEDWGAQPPVCVFKDVSISQETGSSIVGLEIPYTIVGTTTAKFVAAFISKTKNWDDILVVNATENNIEVKSAFQFSIVEYPTSVSKGSVAEVRVSWKGITADNKRYKLIVQLENWQVKPGFVYVKTIDDFKDMDEVTVNIEIPSQATAAKGCRFVAAFISKTKDWDDVFAMTTTKEDVEVK